MSTETETKTFLGLRFDFGVGAAWTAITDPRLIIADQLLTQLAAEERVAFLKNLLLRTVGVNNEKMALTTLDLWLQASDAFEKEKEQGLSCTSDAVSTIRDEHKRQSFDELRALYWQLPDSKKKEGWVNGNLQMVANPTFVELKLKIAQMIGRFWKGRSSASSVKEQEMSEQAFQFLMVAGWPPTGLWPAKRMAELPEDTKRACNRYVSVDEQQGILTILRQGIALFESEELEILLSKVTPPDVEHILIMGRARQGGSPLAQRDIRYAKILGPLKFEGRLPAALDFREQLYTAIVALENAVQNLITTRMRGGSKSPLMRVEKVGASEDVLGEIVVTYHHLQKVLITVTFPTIFPQDLCRDVFARALRHITAWEAKEGKGIEAEVKVQRES